MHSGDILISCIQLREKNSFIFSSLVMYFFTAKTAILYKNCKEKFTQFLSNSAWWELSPPLKKIAQNPDVLSEESRSKMNFFAGQASLLCFQKPRLWNGSLFETDRL